MRHLLEQLLSRALSGSLTADVHSQTEGNPLFVREVARQLTSFDVLPAPGSIVPSLPSGLRDAIGKRLSTLTPGTRQVLSAAAIIGREFDIGLLVRVLAAEEASVTVGLEEATGAGFIEERKALAGAATYRFVHAYFRHVLSDQLAAPRRMQLHRDLARSLEAAHTSHLDDVATELAEHLSHSSDPVDVSAAIHFAEVAAREAMGMFAYDTAVSLFERAWELRKVLNADNSAEACDGLLALGEALVAAGQPRRAVDEVAPRALRIAENLGERRRAFEACALALNGLMSSAAASAQASAEYMDWAESAAGFAQPGTTQEAEAALSLAHARLGTRQE